MDSEFRDIYRAIFRALEAKFHHIGSIIDAEARKLVIERRIEDKGDFRRNLGYAVVKTETSLDLKEGSNVSHAPYVLGGKVPSWTPLEPLKSWVERKGFSWVDKITGKVMTIEQMAIMIRAKIRREGIKGRNIFAEIMKNKKQWIFNELDRIVVR